jgi:predicted homoserine dehydrogenase-like protein
MKSKEIYRIGIIGTGFIGSGLKRTIDRLPDMEVSRILTQRDLTDFPDEGIYTHSVQDLIDHSDLVVECNGNPVYATGVLCQVMDASLPVVTMDAELHVTTGTYLAKKGLITEAEGDQPGALAVLNRKLVEVGFKPLVYGNLKGFLNLTPTLDEMAYWAEKQGISVEQVTGATDGTKIQIEQVFVANGLGAVIGKQGLFGYESMDISEGAQKLALSAKEIGQPISDYLLCSPKAKHRFPAGVFITAEYDSVEAPTFEYLKLGGGPFYTMLQSFHLIYLEIPVTIRQVLQGEGVLLNNGLKPKASVCTIAKHKLNPGTVIKREDRNFHVRGEAIPIADAPNHIPIGLMYDVVIKRKIEPGQMLVFEDVEIQESKAYHAWEDTLSSLR